MPSTRHWSRRTGQHRRWSQAERAALLTRVVDLWSRARDAAERAGCERDDAVEEILVALIAAGEQSDGLELLERELCTESAHCDEVQHLHLLLTRHRFATQANRSQATTMAHRLDLIGDRSLSE